MTNNHHQAPGNSPRIKRKAHLLREECVACGSCSKACPKGAIAIYKGLYALVDFTLCVGCGKCARECPGGIITIKEV